MYDDYVELRPGAAKDLGKLLNEAYTNSRPVSGDRQSASEAYVSSTPQTGRTPQQQQMPNTDSPFEHPARTYNPHPQYEPYRSTIIPCEPEKRWLLICAQARKRPIGLEHFDICRTSSDQELFTKMKIMHLRLRARWSNIFSLRWVKGIRFVKVCFRSQLSFEVSYTCT